MTKRQEMIFTVIQDLMLAFVINSAATILNGGFTDTGTYLVGMFEGRRSRCRGPGWRPRTRLA